MTDHPRPIVGLYIPLARAEPPETPAPEWLFSCPCGVSVRYPLNGLPRVSTRFPCGNPAHWVVYWEGADADEAAWRTVVEDCRKTEALGGGMVWISGAGRRAVLAKGAEIDRLRAELEQVKRSLAETSHAECETLRKELIDARVAAYAARAETAAIKASHVAVTTDMGACSLAPDGEGCNTMSELTGVKADLAAAIGLLREVAARVREGKAVADMIDAHLATLAARPT